jgi:hypothetical protein
MPKTRIPQNRRLKMLMWRIVLIAALAATGGSGFTQPAHAAPPPNYGNLGNVPFADLPVPSYIYGHLAFPGPPRSGQEIEEGAIVPSHAAGYPPFGISNPGGDPQWNPLWISAVSAILTFRSNANTEKEVTVPLYQFQAGTAQTGPQVLTILEIMGPGPGLRYRVQLSPDRNMSEEPTLLPPANTGVPSPPKIRHNPDVWRFHRIKITFDVNGQAGTIPVTFTESGKLIFPDWAP